MARLEAIPFPTPPDAGGGHGLGDLDVDDADGAAGHPEGHGDLVNVGRQTSGPRPGPAAAEAGRSWAKGNSDTAVPPAWPRPWNPATGMGTSVESQQ